MMKCGEAASLMKRTRYSGWPLVILLLCAITPNTLYGQQVTLSEAFIAGQKAFKSTSSACMAPTFANCPAAPKYDLIALRVQFQADTTRFTTGNGTFSGALFDSLEAKVDPLPHDAAYFDAHLQFLSNYIEQASDGNTVVETHLIPEVITLPGLMGSYSPTGLESDSDEELGKLARLVQQAWSLADAQGTLDVSGFDPATTAFMIFHAGVGRDIELIGTTLDKTPEDLPTIFFNQESLNRLVQQSISFKGMPVQHTMLMPRTETRQGFDFIQDQPFLVEFSINGLMAASFLNYLGVPDLFNTDTGESAIGPFGLMDPLGLFAYNGLFPPEPSGWTKQYLGWAQPALIGRSIVESAEIDLLAASLPSGQQLIKVPVSESEYFLVENRYRDLNNDGLVLTIYRDGATFQQRVTNGQEDFNSFDVSGFDGGVVVDVDDYDWALPGGIDENDNPLLGGALVWHIDERVLAEKLVTNDVNSDPELRAVDLEEADSAQDIGFPSGSIFGPQAHLGTPFDFFYEGNPVVVITSSGEEISLYQNRFGSDTVPNSNTNAGGSSFIELFDFSRPGSKITFRYARREPAGIRYVNEFDEIGNLSVPDYSRVVAVENPEMGVYFLGENTSVGAFVGPVVSVFADGRFLTSPVVFPGDQTIFLEVESNGQLSLSGRRINDGSFKFLLDVAVGSGAGFSVQNGLLYEPVQNAIYAIVNSASYNGLLQITLNSTNATASEVSSPFSRSFSMAATDAGQLGVLSEQGVFWLGESAPAWSVDFIGSQLPGQLVLGEDNSGTVGLFTLPQSNQVVFLSADGSVQSFDVSQFLSGGSISRLPVLVDLDQDGRLDALFSAGERLLAISAGGGLVDGFPLSVESDITTQPLLARSVDGESWYVFVGTSGGQLYGLDLGNDGQVLAGFPLSVGAGVNATPLIDGNRIYAISSTGVLSVWETDLISEPWWGMQGGDRFNRNFVRSIVEDTGVVVEGLLLQDQVYNWPNPVREGQTFFRLTSSTDVDVRITIIDAAGTLVDQLDAGLVRAQLPVDVQWNTDAGSGLYFARVEATDSNGNSETSLIKMAVIR